MATPQYPLLNNFSRGELSSRMSGRVDLPGYYQGCKRMRNCIMVSQGGAEKRPGTEYLGETYDPEGYGVSARLIAFEVSDEESYIVEFGHKSLRIWDTRTKQVVSDVGNGTPYLETTYSASPGNDEVSELQYALTEGTMFLSHINHPFMYLKRIETIEIDGSSTITFEVGAHNIEVFPWESGTAYTYKDVVRYGNDYFRAIVEATNTTDVPAAGTWEPQNCVTGGEPTADISRYIGGGFTAGDFCLYHGIIYKAQFTYGSTSYPGVGVEILIDEPGPISQWSYEGRNSDIQNYSREDALADIEKYRGGTNITIVLLSYDRYYGGKYGSCVCKYQANYKKITSSENDKSTRHWLKVGVCPGGSSILTLYKWDTTADAGEYHYDPLTFEIYKCLEDGTTLAPADVPEWEKLENNPFFAVEGDYPASCAFMNGRLYLAGTKYHPQTIYGSAVGNYSDFNEGTNDDDAFSFEIASERSSRIKWMMAKDNLMIGTTSSEWLISGGGIANITATNVQVLRQSAYGSAYNQAHYVADSLLFYQKGGRKLREYMYSNDNKAYLANDLTFYADHITESGISESAYQLNPDSIYWNIKKNGGLIGLTYDRLNKIFGWHYHDTKGVFESVCVVDGEGSEEEIWVVVRRTINGVNKRYVEVFSPRAQEDISLLRYSDSGKTFSAGGKYKITSITNNTTYIEIAFVGSSGLSNDDNIKISNTDNPLFDAQDFVVSDLVQGVESGTFRLKRNGDYFTADPFETIGLGLVSRSETVITGLDHLEGEEVVILGDGAVFTNKTVGAVTGGIGVVLESSCNTVVCGLEYEMELEPQSLELGPSTVSAKKRISSALLKLYKSLGGRVYSTTSGEEEVLNYRATDVEFGSGPALYTGNITVPVEADSNQEASIIIKNKQPVPMTVIAIVTGVTYVR